MKKSNNRFIRTMVGIVITTVLAISGGCSQQLAGLLNESANETTISKNVDNVESFPEYDGEHSVISVNENSPTFTNEDLTTGNGAWQTFSDLDTYNRVGSANAMLHKSMMPTEDRGDIQNVYPSGWHQKKIGNKWLYNRSHVIGHRLTGENDNWKNLFTGTEQMNQRAMVEYENHVAEYLRITGNHVRYRVTPKFYGEELVCRGIQMEAQSIENDQLSFNVFLYNIEDGVTIDYSNGYATIE